MPSLTYKTFHFKNFTSFVKGDNNKTNQLVVDNEESFMKTKIQEYWQRPQYAKQTHCLHMFRLIIVKISANKLFVFFVSFFLKFIQTRFSASKFSGQLLLSNFSINLWNNFPVFSTQMFFI